jgi:uncharacterized protein YukE
MTYVNPIPSTYNSSSISVDPGGLGGLAQDVLAQVQDISNYLSDINAALKGLHLDWVGQASTSASDFNTEWNNAVQRLFGTSGDPSSGALNALTNGLNQAAQNYSGIEDAIVNMFNNFANGFNKPPSDPQTVTDQRTDQIDGGNMWLYHTTSVNETY